MPPAQKQSATRTAKAKARANANTNADAKRGTKTKSRVKARARASANRAAYLNRMSTAVRSHFAEATDLPTFLEGAGQLTAEQRKLIVRQALILIEQNYAHLPLKRAMHSVDPVQRLKLLLQALERARPEDEMSEAEFHHEITDIISSLRDLHTNYLLPAPFNQMTAFLPFMVEDYFENGKRRYIVSRVTQGVSQPTFVNGVELVYWNGMPIERAVWNNAQRFAGSNREARHARGVQTLTLRALQVAPPPDEEWVVVGYRTAEGKLEEIRFHWQVNPPLPSAMGAAADGGEELATAAVLGLDLEQDIVRRMRIALFAPQVVKARQKAEDKSASGAAFGALESKLPSVFTAKEITTTSGKFGYLRIWTFGHPRTEEFVQEFIRLVSSLPQNGLVVDVRGNGGGVIMNGEYILQTLTPRRIEPEPVQFVNTALNLQICRRNGPGSTFTNLSPWVDSMEQALRTGSVFSAGFPISDPVKANAIGQKYFGPVVLITDALCYSTTDIFAAGFQDHEIGPILGTDGNTGAGGANVWEHRFFVSHLLPGGGVYEPLPNGAGMRVSMRRTLRVGRRAGAPLEDLGVVPDERHLLTKNDVVNDNADLLNRAGALLAAQTVRALKVTAQSSSSTQATLLVESTGMTRLDVYVGDRPNQSVDVKTSPTTLVVPKGAGQATIEIRGFDGAKQVARYRMTV
ncbi:MAG TPA: S41 family peptidase [Longimicrobium sp.]|nr:S41 family peptidase [Longimicrobium sp.]